MIIDRNMDRKVCILLIITNFFITKVSGERFFTFDVYKNDMAAYYEQNMPYSIDEYGNLKIMIEGKVIEKEIKTESISIDISDKKGNVVCFLMLEECYVDIEEEVTAGQSIGKVKGLNKESVLFIASQKPYKIEGEGNVWFFSFNTGITGLPVYALSNGSVEKLGYDADMGYFVKNNSEEYNIMYGNLSAIYLQKNENVISESTIGSTGRSGGVLIPTLTIGVEYVEIPSYIPIFVILEEEGERTLKIKELLKEQLNEEIVRSNSLRTEAFSVYNYSSKEVVINVEFWEGESEEIHNYMWTQEVSGMRITIEDFMSVVHRNVLRPKNDYLTIIEYYPRVPLKELTATYSKMYTTPFMEKMKAIFKKLEIICDDGKRVITLENLGDQIVKKRVIFAGTWYILEIFEYDVEGKPASEW